MLYCDTKLELAGEEYTVCRARSGSAWFNTETKMRVGYEKGRCPLCGEENDVIRVLLGRQNKVAGEYSLLCRELNVIIY
jgi:hypothetical protein